jgi:hypothetical protein
LQTTAQNLRSTGAGSAGRTGEKSSLLIVEKAKNRVFPALFASHPAGGRDFVGLHKFFWKKSAKITK